MKNEIACPVCGRMFSPKTPYTHIQQHHKGAKDSELAKIRDARRKCFDEVPERKKGDRRCLPEVALYRAGYRSVREEATHIVK
ncbi:Phage protein [Sodalis praecaptivus]|uniref:Phage protein n=1 Tax=Sodalis praecaptivus TaxID=1239307 RepID=W0HZM1_9GAMM|nr:hypothetical protein [Sodalis praecaptivus]AHF77937.1 Phage protein [Sodalis praecaptivus]